MVERLQKQNKYANTSAQYTIAIVMSMLRAPTPVKHMRRFTYKLSLNAGNLYFVIASSCAVLLSQKDTNTDPVPPSSHPNERTNERTEQNGMGMEWSGVEWSGVEWSGME